MFFLGADDLKLYELNSFMTLLLLLPLFVGVDVLELTAEVCGGDSGTTSGVARCKGGTGDSGTMTGEEAPTAGRTLSSDCCCKTS